MEDQENRLKPVPDWSPEVLKVTYLDASLETSVLHAGDMCPRCQRGVLDYDGLLNLACSQCGYSLGGCFT